MPTSPAIVVSGLRGGADDILQAALSDYDLAAIDERSDDEWRVFFHHADDRDRAIAELRTRFSSLQFSALDVEDEGWAERSQADLHAIQAGRVIVAPPWDVPTTIVIQPSMGFGTGHHATTRLCLVALQRLTLRERRVLDVGTGSGVLAIAASRLGAATVTGIDDDPDAIHAAWENLSLNPGATVSLLVGDFRSMELVHADVVLANLTGGLLVNTARRLRELTAAHGRLVLSGFTVREEAEVVSAFAAFTVEHRDEEDGWVAVTLAGTP